jgi:hypothetical protein
VLPGLLLCQLLACADTTCIWASPAIGMPHLVATLCIWLRVDDLCREYICWGPRLHAALRNCMSAPLIFVPKGGFMMTVSGCICCCWCSRLTSHSTKSICRDSSRSNICVRVQLCKHLQWPFDPTRPHMLAVHCGLYDTDTCKECLHRLAWALGSGVTSIP